MLICHLTLQSYYCLWSSLSALKLSINNTVLKYPTTFKLSEKEV